MIRHLLSRFLTALALVCASVAWGCWAYLNTVADPHRAELVADAVLADAEAREELAAPLAEQVVELAGLDAASEPEIRAAVVAVMADPRISGNLTDAVGAAHARTFGVPDPRPSTIDGSLLVTAIREHLAGASPALAARIPADLVGDIEVPEHELPFVAGLRTLATNVTEWFGAAAIGLLTFSFLAGDRAGTLRRYGYWAISAGLVWALGPRLVVLGARKFFTSGDATLAAGVGAATKTVTVVATILVATGIAALVAGYMARLVPSGGRVDRPFERFSDHRGEPLRAPRPSRVERPLPDPSSARPVDSSYGTGMGRITPVARVETTEPTPIVPVEATTVASVEATTVLPVVPGPPVVPVAPIGGPPGPIVAGDLPLAAPVVPAVPDVDPWALFSGPAIDPTTGDVLPRRPESGS